MAQRPQSLVGGSMCLLIPTALAVLISPALGGPYDPESPQVKALLEKALTFLEMPQQEDRLGGLCLMGMAFHKAGYEADHPRITAAVQACQAAAEKGPRDLGDDAMYSIAIAAVFLADLNPTLHRGTIDTLMSWMADAQKPHGGWGYYERHRTGDTSMTQYAVLALWTTQQSGIPVNPNSIRNVAQWLIRTQDPSGRFGYQGIDPGNYNRVRQRNMNYSLLAAGLGSTYICADMLGITSNLKKASLNGIRELPEAFVLVDDGGGETNRVLASPDLAGMLGRATNDGNRWFDDNYNIDPNERYPIYYLYALERYMSFRELAEGEMADHVSWYDDGVEYLANEQGEDGEWTGGCGTAACTALGALFLMRSTKKSIDKANYGQGVLSGGRGLPKDISNARVRRGKVVSEPLGGKAEDVLAILEDPDNPKYEALVDNPGAITLSSDAANQGSEIERFRRILQSSDQALARRLAVKALSQRRDLENVPTLIYALTDGDRIVAVGARDALRLVSRKFDGFGMSDNPSKRDKIAATVKWKEWYRSIRPDAEFIQ